MEDCVFYDDCSSNRLSTEYTQNNNIVTYETTSSYKFTSSTYNTWESLMLNKELPDNWIIEYDAKIQTNSDYIFCTGLVATINDGKGANTILCAYPNNNLNWGITYNGLSTSYQHIKIIKQDTSYKLYVDDVLCGTKTISNTNKYLRLDTISYGLPLYVWLKNLKIKPYSGV